MHDAYHVQAHSSNASKIKEEKSVKKEIDQSEIQTEEAKDSKVQKKTIPSNLLHQRMGHRSPPVLLNASHNEVWKDTRMGFERDAFCEGCKISTSRKSNRDKTTSAEALQVTRPGQAVTMDIIPNKHDHCTISYHWHKYYLLVCDMYSKYSMFLKMKNDKAASAVEALDSLIETHQCMSTFYSEFIQAVRSDAGTASTSKKFVESCEEQHIRFSHAAPRHQEMNDIAERTRQSLYELTFSIMVHAQVGNEIYDYALQHAWKVFNCLPVRGLEIDGPQPHHLKCSLVKGYACPSSK